MSRSSLFRTIIPASVLSLILSIAVPAVCTQVSQLDQIQVAPPMRQVQAPPPTASAKELEQQADELRSQKAYIDAIDYFHAAIMKDPGNAVLFNKKGIAELMLQRYHEAGRDFEEAIRLNAKLSEAYNNLGVVHYERKKYRAAAKQYKKAAALNPESASFYSNLGAVYFAQRKFEPATKAYSEALKRDPDIFEHSSRTGVTAQMSSPQDRAHYSYVLAKLYAKMGDSDHSLLYLRRAMEEGYKKVEDAMSDPEFASLRKDTRFEELMKEKPVAIPE